MPPGFLNYGFPILGDYDGDHRAEVGRWEADSGGPDWMYWVTTVHESAALDSPLRPDQGLLIKNSVPAPYWRRRGSTESKHASPTCRPTDHRPHGRGGVG